jgi:hypothetical protein
MNNLRGVHLVAGLLGLIAFVLTGQYMELTFAHLRGMPDAPRLMYRSAHIYILYVALLNLLLGCYFRPLAGTAAQRMQLIGSLLVLIVPVLLLVSFFAESHNNPLSRPIAVIGIYLSLAGCGLHCFASIANRKDPVTS